MPYKQGWETLVKKYYYERYKKTGKLDTLEPWNN